MNSIPTLETASALTKDQETFGRFLDGYACARGDSLVPRLEDYLLDELLPFLEEVTVLEVGGPGDTIYRLCGTRAVDRLGMEATGLNMLDFVPEIARSAVYMDISAVVTRPCGHYSRHHNLYADGLSVEAETISLPVQSEGDAAVNFMLSLLSVEETVLGQPPVAEPQIGTNWLQSLFIDVGNGIPEQSGLNEMIEQLRKPA